MITGKYTEDEIKRAIMSELIYCSKMIDICIQDINEETGNAKQLHRYNDAINFLLELSPTFKLKLEIWGVKSTRDLKGRIRWSDNQWINLAINKFEKEKGSRPNFKDEYVDRIYD